MFRPQKFKVGGAMEQSRIARAVRDNALEVQGRRRHGAKPHCSGNSGQRPRSGPGSATLMPSPAKSFNYGFVEYDDPRRVHQQEMRGNWAYQSNTISKEDTSNHPHISAGDLSNEVNGEVLLSHFFSKKDRHDL
jgi:hypothetical protein